MDKRVIWQLAPYIRCDTNSGKQMNSLRRTLARAHRTRNTYFQSANPWRHSSEYITHIVLLHSVTPWFCDRIVERVVRTVARLGLMSVCFRFGREKRLKFCRRKISFLHAQRTNQLGCTEIKWMNLFVDIFMRTDLTISEEDNQQFYCYDACCFENNLYNVVRRVFNFLRIGSDIATSLRSRLLKFIWNQFLASFNLTPPWLNYIISEKQRLFFSSLSICNELIGCGDDKLNSQYFQNSAPALLMAACLFATIYASLGMNTVYYRNGERCEACAEEHVPYRQQQTQTYYPSNGAQRVVYRTEERIITRPSSSSSSYIANRADTAYYSDSNFIH